MPSSSESKKKACYKWRTSHRAAYNEYQKGLSKKYYAENRELCLLRKRQHKKYADEAKRLRNILL